MEKVGKYEILEELGRGTMGTVFRARDPFIDRLVALKTIRLQGFTGGDEAGYRERFFREAQAAGKLRHPGIVTIFEVGVDESTGTPFIAMLLLEGPTLDRLVNDSPAPLPLAQSLQIVKRLAEALDHAHSMGVVHRDIKPANIIVSPHEGAVITDFGVARLRKSQLTVQGELVGTPAFMAPEQVQGERVDGRADLFSLGVILYWMLTGQRPFTGDMTEVMFKIVSDQPRPATQLNPSLPPDVDLVLARALAKSKDARYQSGREFAADLACLLEGRPPAFASAPPQAVPAEERTLRLPPDDAAATGPALSTAIRGERAADRSGTIVAPLAEASAPPPATGFAAAARRLPVAAQAGIAVGVLLLLALGLMLLQTKPAAQATLYIELHHNFEKGTLTVTTDKKELVQEDLVADERRRTLTGMRFTGRYTKFAQIDAGRRVVRVRVTAPGEEFDLTREVSGEFAAGENRTLNINCDARRKSLQLVLR
jgi:serine/threonine-protein kinase